MEKEQKQIPEPFYQGFSELVEAVWTYLWNVKGFHYEKAVIRQYLAALCSNQMILLWGQPGTGKTSLSKEIADAIGGACITISVQPNWTDNQDLLGYYNTVDMMYQPTVFMDALVEAKENPEKLYLIVLDEMNLAHVEYYFSEVLSGLSSGESCTLHLYSRGICERVAGELVQILQELDQEKEKGEKQDPYRLLWLEQESKKLRQQLFEMKEKYAPEFRVPSNVRFIGTLNMDSTTRDISPKVRDRSFVIEVGMDAGEEPSAEKVPVNDRIRMCRAECFRPSAELAAAEDVTEKAIWKPVRNLQEALRAHGLILSYRFEMQLRQMLYAVYHHPCVRKNVTGDTEMQFTSYQDFLDDMMLGKVLPCLEIQDEKDGVVKALEDWMEHPTDEEASQDILMSVVLGRESKAWKKLENIKHCAKRYGVGTYWNSEG